MSGRCFPYCETGFPHSGSVKYGHAVVVKVGLYVRFLCLFVTFMSACCFLFRKFQLSKFFTSEMNIYAVLCMKKGNRKTYLQPESGTIRHSYSVLMPV